MWKNYLVTAIRNLKKHKGHSLINIMGLAIGMAVSLLIFLQVGVPVLKDNDLFLRNLLMISSSKMCVRRSQNRARKGCLALKHLHKKGNEICC